MGTSGHGSFENDASQDWLWDLEGDRGWTLVERTLHSLLDADFRDIDFCQEAIAAAEVVAACRGKAGVFFSDNPHHVEGRSRPSQTLTTLAKKAVAMVGQDSEAKTLWSSGDEYGEWLGALQELQTRLG